MDFASAATRFCSVVERVGRGSRSAWLADLESSLATLYAAGVSLPENDEEIPSSRYRMSHEEWVSLFSSLRDEFGVDDRYTVLMNGSPVAASLADDLANVYREVNDGLEALTSGAAPDVVIGEWAVGFSLHWAAHALGALSALRTLAGREI